MLLPVTALPSIVLCGVVLTTGHLKTQNRALLTNGNLITWHMAKLKTSSTTGTSRSISRRVRRGAIEFDDETLRDGLQSPSVTDPSLDEKIQILHFMNDIGVDNADIGLPGAGPHVQRTVEALAREIVNKKLSVYPSAAGPHARERRASDHRDLAARRHPDRSGSLHRLIADPAVHRGVGHRLDHRAVGEGRSLRDRERHSGDVRDRRHDAGEAGRRREALHRGDRRGAKRVCIATRSDTPRRGVHAISSASSDRSWTVSTRR